MTSPRYLVRRNTYNRDKYCLSCGSSEYSEWQHRQAVGMGGSKHYPTPDEGIMACTTCNTAFEAGLQTLALACGWKVKKFITVPIALVPVFSWPNRAWYRLDEFGGREEISGDVAVAAMRLVYGGEWDEWFQSLNSDSQVWMLGREVV